MAENFFGITDLGKVRQNNEDTFIAQPTANGRYVIACVIDGVGGYSGGEIAAEIARETIVQRLNKISGDIVPLLIDAFNLANEKIWQEKQAVPAHKSMACVVTLVLADITGNQFYYVHIGDTRLYLLRDGSLVKISQDQSFVGFLEDSGRLTEKEAMRHGKRNEIDKALGFKTALNSDDVETGQSPFLPGDMLLLCSDGLTDVVDKAAITEVVTTTSSLKAIANGLIEAANDGGGKDNITVVLVKNDKTRQEHAATKPTESIAAPKPERSTHEKKTAERAGTTSANGSSKSYKGLFMTSLVLFIAAAIFCGWQWANYHNSSAPVEAPVKPVKTRNAQEIKLQAAIDQHKGKLLLLSDTAFRSPVVISSPIFINRDSLDIKAKGNITFVPDSGFTGPVFILNSATKYIVLDSLTFQNFGTALSGFNRSLVLKNVRFKDCKTDLLNIFDFADHKYITGSFPAALFRTDSLPKAK